MIAEIHNKISSTGSNLSDRLEDQLTGDFFGAMRYLPFQYGLRLVLQVVRFPDQASAATGWDDFLNTAKDYKCESRFWYRHAEGEIDLILDHPEAVVGIEVKYGSGLSSEDEESDVIITPKESKQQLARYSRLLEDYRQGRPAYLVFLAPFSILTQVESSMEGRSLIAGDVKLGFLAWQHVLEALQVNDTTGLEKGQRIILEDIKQLLSGKGFVRFKGFRPGGGSVPLTDEAYIFGTKLKLQWPLCQIKEDDYYVFNR
ncbi:hypothetical protein [Paenibacillus apii]|uniref:hypothetical protein n=1 Tax=Paenibacillus apii TaxID=1850370 RepID=UPI00197E3F1E|nr:hypothetical protein [Paenibacillus apii]